MLPEPTSNDRIRTPRGRDGITEQRFETSPCESTVSIRLVWTCCHCEGIPLKSEGPDGKSCEEEGIYRFWRARVDGK